MPVVKRSEPLTPGGQCSESRDNVGAEARTGVVSSASVDGRGWPRSELAGRLGSFGHNPVISPPKVPF